MNRYDLKGKIAIVTGARQGMGRAIAMRFAREGARVCVSDVDKEDCEAVVREIKESGGEAVAARMDVTSEAEIIECTAMVRKTFGPIDILVNNAGIGGQSELDKMSTSDIDRIIAVDLRGPILCCKHVIKEMKLRHYGKIVNTASTAGFTAFPLSSIYCATKAGIINLTRELAMEYGKYKINVNAVAPGGTETPLTQQYFSNPENLKAALARTPYGRLGQPADIANAVAFLASDESEFITGHTLVVDGGRTTH